MTRPLYSPTSTTLDTLVQLGVEPQSLPSETDSPAAVPLACGHITALVGPSGCGKSRALAHLLKRSGERFHVVSSRDVPRSNLWPLDWIDAMGLGEKAGDYIQSLGLLDAKLLRTPLRCLSAGQRSRVALLATLCRCEEGDAFLIDEFGADLDDLSARALATSVRRWVNRLSLRCAIATHRESIVSDLGPDVLIRFSSNGDYHTTSYPRRLPLVQSMRVREATKEDWKTFAPYHHRGHHLAPTWRIWCAEIDGRDVGIVVYSYAGHSCRARRGVLPEELCTGEIGERIEEVNGRLRVLQRVVVLPELRGVGIATELVKRTLPKSDVEFVESIAMHAGFLERAGMTRTGEVRRGRQTGALFDFLDLHGARARDLVSDAARETFRESLGDGERDRFDQLLRAAFRVYVETRHSTLRGHVSRTGISEEASAMLDEFFTRIDCQPDYYVWANPKLSA